MNKPEQKRVDIVLTKGKDKTVINLDVEWWSDTTKEIDGDMIRMVSFKLPEDHIY